MAPVNNASSSLDDDMLPEYDFSKMGKPVRGKYADRLRQEGYSVTVHHEDGTSTTRYVSPEEVQQQQSQRETSRDQIIGDKVMGDKIAGDKIMGNKVTHHFNGSMSGVIGSDNATVENNTFNQTNNANTAELLQLIASLRQTAATFPTETKEEIETDLEDLETELGKPPEQRNNTRIKKRLIALFTAATMIAGTVANVTDFTNTAIDLGQKLNLDLPALVGR